MFYNFIDIAQMTSQSQRNRTGRHFGPQSMIDESNYFLITGKNHLYVNLSVISIVAKYVFLFIFQLVYEIEI